MKAVKKVLSLIVCVVVVLTVIPFGNVTANAETYGNFEYTVSDGEVTITDYTGSANIIYISSTLEDYTVTAIGEAAFEDCHTITDIVISNSVTTIGNSAFANCSNLESVNIPDNVSNFGDFVFSGCNNLAEIYVSENNLYYSSSDGILFDKNKTKIIAYPPAKADTEYSIPEGVTSLDACSFDSCINLTRITLPDSITHIEEGTFKNCSSLTDIEISDENSCYFDIYGVLFEEASNSLFTYPCGRTEATYSIPKNTAAISDYAFYNSKKLNYVTIPDSVRTFGDYAFAYCTYLSNLTIPYGVTAIGDMAFSDCLGFTSIYFPDSVTSIGEGVCCYCRAITSIRLPDSITNIPVDSFIDTAFYVDESNWTDGVLYINNHLIKTGYNIETDYVINPKTVTIAENAFKYAQELSSITIPESIKYIGDGAFNGCELLEKVYYVGSESEKENLVIGDNNSPLLNATWQCDAVLKVFDLTAKCTSNGIKLNWEKSKGATNYRVYRSVYSNGGWSEYKLYSKPTTTTYTDKNVSSGTQVLYIVFAQKGSFISPESTPVNITYLAQPTVKISSASTGIKLSWNKISGATGYRIYRSVYSGGAWSDYESYSSTVSTSYTDTDVKSGSKVRYTVYSYNYNSTSAYKTGVSTLYLAKPKIKLTNVKTGVYVSWGKVSGATSYKVYRSSYSGGKWSKYKLFAKPTSNYYTDKTAKAGTKYKYIVYACKGDYKSYNSSSAVTVYLSPRTPKVSKASTGIKVSWTKATGAKGYIVYRRAYSGGKWSELKAMYKTTKLTVTDKTAKKGVKYQYVVRAYNGDYRSAIVYSATVKR